MERAKNGNVERAKKTKENVLRKIKLWKLFEYTKEINHMPLAKDEKNKSFRLKATLCYHHTRWALDKRTSRLYASSLDEIDTHHRPPKEINIYVGSSFLIMGEVADKTISNYSRLFWGSMMYI